MAFARALYDRILDYARSEVSQLRFDWHSLTWNRENRSSTVGQSAGESLFFVEENEMVLQCLLQLAPKMRPYTQSTDHSTDEFLRFVVKREIMKKGWMSIRCTWKKEGCTEEVARNICLRPGMK